MSNLPPVLELLNSVNFIDKDIKGILKSAKKLIPDITQQAEWTLSNHTYVDNQPNDLTKFNVSPVSGMNPFGDFGKCSGFDCRISMALNFSRTIGLYSEVIYLPDPFTTKFIDDGNKDLSWTDDQVLELIKEATVLQVLRPLIEAGIIQFTSPVRSYCAGCLEKLYDNVDNFTDEAIQEFWHGVSHHKSNDHLVLDTNNLHVPSLMLSKFIDPALKNRKTMKTMARQMFGEIIWEEIHELLFTMNTTESMNSTIFSNSRIGLKTLKKLEGNDRNVYNHLNWENSRDTNLPWIKDLTPQQVVELRNSADKALPQFRELMLKSLTQENLSMSDNESKSSELLTEMRTQAEEVRAELSSIDINSEKNFHNMGGILGMTISIYSAATGNPALGLTTLMATLGLIHTNLKKDHSEVNKAISKPGYVLVKAKDILQHANKSSK
ncbi:hypothetical protein [Methyloradius palustris]|uniref:Uncharacterized protein n=1 Tax=Methyloradius palustris TaxID=2778876 RepID=A0A8D5G1Z9_9PROT|nr:hypothetical protein [Methyloradius palustris]BCM24210.1 hypothetical protein ZMTM_04690 [Methyloradius palustris]